MRTAAKTREPFRQNRRLIIAPLPEPPAMQGHRNNHVRLDQQRASRAFQPACEGRRTIEAVAMFETEYQGFRRVVVAKERAGAIEIRRFGMARPTDRFAARINVERHAASPTQSAIDKGNRAPA